MTYRIDGGPELSRALRRMPEEVRKQIRPALQKSADELVSTMKALAPVDDGNLRDSIRQEAGQHDMEIVIKAGGNKAWYAPIVEFGHPNAAPRPFFWPAYRSLRNRIRGRINRAINAAARGFSR